MINFKTLALTTLIGLTGLAPLAVKADLRGDYSTFQDDQASLKEWCKDQYSKVTH